MAEKSKKGEGFQSAAGLIRYFDAEDETALKIDPRWVLGFCFITIVGALAFTYSVPV